MGTFLQNITVEAWVLWSLGIVFIGCRMVSRRIVLGSWRKLQIDDYIMLFITATFTATIVSVIEVASNGSNYLPPGAAELLTPDEVVSAIYGSLMTFVLEEFTLATTWMVKACLLIMYSRLTSGLRQNLAVKIVGGYCIFGYFITQILFLGVWCKPIEEYWKVPVGNPQCATYYNHLITATIFNISSDLMMLAIPIPILIRSQLPLKRKLILCLVFSLGIFVILAAILNRYYNFTVAYSPIFLNWYIGEVSTAVYVANIPLCWPLIRRVFRIGTFAAHSSDPNYTYPNTTRNQPSAGSRFYPRHPLGSERGVSSDGERAMGRIEESDAGPKRNLGFNESEERINASWTNENGGRAGGEPLELTPIDPRTGHKATVATQAWNEEWERGEKYEGTEGKGAIVKTVQISQFTS